MFTFLGYSGCLVVSESNQLVTVKQVLIGNYTEIFLGVGNNNGKCDAQFIINDLNRVIEIKSGRCLVPQGSYKISLFYMCFMQEKARNLQTNRRLEFVPLQHSRHL